MMSAPNNSFLLSDQDTNQFFWYRRRLNPKYLIQSLKTLLVRLTKTHNFFWIHICFKNKSGIFVKKFIYIWPGSTTSKRPMLTASFGFHKETVWMWKPLKVVDPQLYGELERTNKMLLISIVSGKLIPYIYVPTIQLVCHIKLRHPEIISYLKHHPAPPW